MEDRFYYYDESGERHSRLGLRIQQQREQRKLESRAQRDAYREKTQKAKEELFSGKKRDITKSTTGDTKQKNSAAGDVTVIKKDQKGVAVNETNPLQFEELTVSFCINNVEKTGVILFRES